jgi:hypothetical protein
MNQDQFLNYFKCSVYSIQMFIRAVKWQYSYVISEPLNHLEAQKQP